MNIERVNAIIQARMGSTRLPGKVLVKIEDVPILEHIIRRLNSVKAINDIIVATSDKQEDDAIAEYCRKNAIPCVRGSEENVLERFALAAKKYPADIYIRATGDNPMIDIGLINDTLEFFMARDLTYSCYKGYPLGSGVEVFTADALAQAVEHADKDFEIEHVTPYMYQSMPGRRVEYFISNTDDSGIRMTVDTEEDLAFAKEMFKRLYKTNKLFGINEIKQVFAEEHELLNINSKVHQKKIGE